MRYYYYPLCSKDFAFENIFASESVSPPKFYSKRGFGINYFYKIPKFHHEDALILYTAPPKYETGSNIDAVKFVLAIAESAIDTNEFIIISEGIIAYQKTIYLTKENFSILFFSEKDQKIISLKSETSLPTKGLKKFESNFKIISESECKEFDLNNLESLKLDNEHLEQEILFDRKFNYFKGFIYGVATGLISTKSPEEIRMKRSFKEITNCFAELKNRYEGSLKESGARYTRANPFSQTSLEVFEKKLKIAINATEKLFSELFPDQVFSEETLSTFLFEKHGKRLSSLEECARYIHYTILGDEILGTNNFGKLKNYFLKNAGGIHVILYFDILKEQSELYSSSAKINSNWSRGKKEDSNEIFKDALFELGKFVEKEFLKKTLTKKVELEAIQCYFYENEISIGAEFQFLNKNEKDEFVIIVNSILKNPKFGKGEAEKEQILAIVENVGNAMSKSKVPQKTQLYQYLNNEINGYSIDKVTSVVMKNFVAFIFNPDSLEKLESFIETKEIEQKWIGYSFWCSFNGFANTSRNFLKPVFDTSNYFLQDYIDAYLKKIISHKPKDMNFSNEIDSQLITVQENRSPYTEGLNELYDKNKNFFEQYDFGKSKITFDQFDAIIRNENNEQIISELKERYKISKKDGKKIVTAYKEFINLTALF
jgi:hypothetical protein